MLFLYSVECQNYYLEGIWRYKITSSNCTEIGPPLSQKNKKKKNEKWKSKKVKNHIKDNLVNC